MQRSGPPSLGGGTRHTAHQCWPHSSHCATACSVQCFAQFITPDRPPRPDRLAHRFDLRTRPRAGPCRFRLVECSAGGRAPLIARYSLPEIADLFTDEARFARLARGRGPRRRGVGQARRRARRRRGRGPRAGRLRRRRGPRARDASPTTTSPRSSTSCRSASASPPARGCTTGSRRATSSTPRSSLQLARAVRPAARRRRRARGGDRRPGPRVPRHADGRAHARHPRRADDVRREARALGAAGAPRPRAARCGPATRSRSASSRARSARTPTSIPRSSATCASALGLAPVPATQVLARDRHAELLYACASVGATVESFALEIRHLQRTEVREVEEPFRAGAQKGSSAMPHKRNPVKSEQLCGLARVLRGNLQAGLEDVALWHERDISHSSVERIILPDSLHARVLRAREVPQHRRGHARVPRAHAARTSTRRSGSCSASRCCSRWSSRARRATTRTAIVQRNAMTHVGGAPAVPRRARATTPRSRAALDDARLAACFDLKRALANVGRIFDALDDRSTPR